MPKLLVDPDAVPGPQVQESELFTKPDDSAPSLSPTLPRRKLKLYTLKSKNSKACWCAKHRKPNIRYGSQESIKYSPDKSTSTLLSKGNIRQLPEATTKLNSSILTDDRPSNFDVLQNSDIAIKNYDKNLVVISSLNNPNKISETYFKSCAMKKLPENKFLNTLYIKNSNLAAFGGRKGSETSRKGNYNNFWAENPLKWKNSMLNLNNHNSEISELIRGVKNLRESNLAKSRIRTRLQNFSLNKSRDFKLNTTQGSIDVSESINANANAKDHSKAQGDLKIGSLTERRASIDSCQQLGPRGIAMRPDGQFKLQFSNRNLCDLCVKVKPKEKTGLAANAVNLWSAEPKLTPRKLNYSEIFSARKPSIDQSDLQLPKVSQLMDEKSPILNYADPGSSQGHNLEYTSGKTPSSYKDYMFEKKVNPLELKDVVVALKKRNRQFY